MHEWFQITKNFKNFAKSPKKTTKKVSEDYFLWLHCTLEAVDYQRLLISKNGSYNRFQSKL